MSKPILYTKNECSKCVLVKNLFMAMELEYETVNIDENAEAKELLVSKGFLALPVLQVEEEFIADVKQIQEKVKELI